MEERAFEAAAGRYGLTDMVAAISMDRAELVVGFVPWEEDATGWARSVSRVRTTIEGEPRLSRTVWDDPARPGARVAIDVYECDSAHQAVHALVEVLAGNHLASVPRGPEGVGLFSFAQPENLPPAVMMVRANLCLVVSSFGTDHVEIVPWAQRLDSRIVERPQAVEEFDLFTEQSRGDGMTLSYHTPWRVGEEGYVKIFSEGGGIEIRDGNLLVGGDEVVVEAYVVEPGRPTYRGRLDVSRP